MIGEIKQNIAIEQDMARELALFIGKLDEVNAADRAMINDVIASIKARMKLASNSLPSLVRGVSFAQPLSNNQNLEGIEQVHFQESNQRVVLRSRDKERFLKELNISEHLIKRLKKRALLKEKVGENYKKPNLYAQLANKFFLARAQKLLSKNRLANLKNDIHKGNVNVLVATYVSMMFFSTVLAVLVGLFLMFFLMFFSFTTELPFLEIYSGSWLPRFVKVFWVVFLPSIITFGLFYFYPYSERRSLTRHIDSELPFVVIHMGSISGSGVEPTHIFKIVGLSKEYPYTRGEIRKLLNQINVYGYDLISALRNVARFTPSQKFAELLNGLGTTISSGGDLKTFFEKRADTLLLNYRLEREKFIKTAETFMDIYISVVIATPMILLLLLVMISVSRISIGLSLGQMTFIIIFIVAFVNVLFLWVLSLRQPNY